MTHYDALPYNVFTGVLPECLQLSTINNIFNEKLRKLPTEKFTAGCENTPPELSNKKASPKAPFLECIKLNFIHDENAKKIEQKVVWQTGRGRKFFSTARTIKRKAGRLLFSCF